MSDPDYLTIAKIVHTMQPIGAKTNAADTLARAVIAQHAELVQFKAALREACEIAGRFYGSMVCYSDDLAKIEAFHQLADSP